MQMNWRKIMAGALLSAAVMGSYTYGSTTYAAAASNAQVSVQQGKANGNVNLRSKPSTSGKIVAKINKGEKVQIVKKSSSSWYEVKTSSGKQGYASSKYIVPGGSTNTVGSSSNNNSNGSASSSVMVENAIKAGMKYLGTPYEFGSDRNTTTTFDCSDFVRRAFLEGTGIKLPSSSRTQGDWIKDKGTAVSKISNLKRGDLVFFMSYKGSSASNYAGLDKSKQRITHVAIYLGDNKLLHTYSQKSGGVLVGNFSDSWKNRFLFGGSVI
ncbi:Cell wall-associated hydrolase, NlpC family [Paenibacillus uliginis N3/975]|uniref:Cell wall-associated hydrolase, NlpC family n=2 Tax=Paenibacillus TaxID=44249 RepID=A0A1X7HQP7_9BACL|nr:SH3 domain-containing C40 family peptidase [Paenibacillus uliginis]SMF90740.1 Cell wall-associated hydrolase, NlpC family [Paenibacillus uliginis N3/975]